MLSKFKKSIVPLFMLFAIVMISACVMIFAPKKVNAGAAEIVPYTIERGVQTYNYVCNDNNGYVPSDYDDSLKPVSNNGQEVNNTDRVNMDIEKNYNGQLVDSAYVRPKDHYYKNTYTKEEYIVHNHEQNMFFDVDHPYVIHFYGDGSSLASDTYKGEIDGVGQIQTAIGKGAIFYQKSYIDQNGNTITSPWISYFNMFGASNDYYVPLDNGIYGKSACDYRFINVYEISKSWFSSYNLRQEFVLKFRLNSNTLFITEYGTSNTKTVKRNDTISTSKGFKIQPEAYKEVEISYNGQGYIPYSYSSLKRANFTSEGEYVIRYKTDIESSYNQVTVYVDKSTPFVYIDDIKCDPSYAYTDKIDGITYKAFHAPQGAIITIPENEGFTTTIKEKKNGSWISITNGSKLSLGVHIIQVTHNHDFTSCVVTYNINIGNYIPNKNFNLLLNSDPYAKQANRYSTEVYGVRLFENGSYTNYCYSTKKSALDKGLEYEWNYVQQDENGVYQYRGTGYDTNEKLTKAMNSYVENNYLFYNRDLTSDETFIMESSLIQSRLYLNNFQFDYNSNTIYSKSVRLYKANKLTTVLSDNIKSILRDSANKDVINIKYKTDLKSQLTESGKYFIRETNVFGVEYFFEAYFAKENDTSANIIYTDSSQNSFSTTVSKDNNPKTINAKSFTIQNLQNEIDPYATVIISNGGELKTIISVSNQQSSKTINVPGEYNLLFIDRNGNKFSLDVIIHETPYILEGNFIDANISNSAVTIYLLQDMVVSTFIVAEIPISPNVFVPDESNPSYKKYTIEQTEMPQDVILIATFNNEEIIITFHMLAKG